MEKLKYEAIATGFGLLEAPRVDDKGRIYFTDVSRGGVYRVIPGGKPETLIPGSAGTAWAGSPLPKTAAWS